MLSWGTKDAVIFVGFVPHVESATNLVSVRVANLRLEFCALEVHTVVPVLQISTCPHVRAAYLPQLVRGSIIRLASTRSKTLDFFKFLDTGFPLSRCVTSDVQIPGRYLETSPSFNVTDSSKVVCVCVCVARAQRRRKLFEGYHTFFAHAFRNTPSIIRTIITPAGFWYFLRIKRESTDVAPTIRQAECIPGLHFWRRRSEHPCSLLTLGLCDDRAETGLCTALALCSLQNYRIQHP